MDIQQLKKEGINHATLAVQLDKDKKYEEAVKEYTRAAEKLKLVSEMDENKYSKDTYKNKAIEYAQRASEIKKKLANKVSIPSGGA